MFQFAYAIIFLKFQSWSALSFGASKISGKVAEVGWKFTEVATQKVSEVSGVVTDKVGFLFVYILWMLLYKEYLI